MVLLSLHGLAPSQIAELLDCRPAAVRGWTGRFNDEGLAGPGSMSAAVAAVRISALTA